MAKISLIRTESNLGFKMDSRLEAADTTGNVRFFNRVTGVATEPNATNRTNLAVTLDKDNDSHEIMIFGTVGAASSGVSAISGIIRQVSFNGVNLSAGTGVEHQAEAEGGCADIANLWNQAYDVFAGTHATNANNFRVGDETASDISYYFQNDHTTLPRLYWDDSQKRLKMSWGDDAPAAGDIDNTPQLTTAERDALTWPTGGVTIYNTTTNVTQFREGGTWVGNAAGGTVADATDTTSGKVELVTTAEATAADDAGTVGPNVMIPSETARVIQNASYSYAVDAEASDAYAITLVPAISAYADGQHFSVKCNTANTGAASLNANGEGAITIKKLHDQDLETGDIEADQIIDVVYNSDGPKFQLQSQLAQAAAGTLLTESRKNYEINTREFYPIQLAIQTATSGSTADAGGARSVTTQASANATAEFRIDWGSLHSTSLHNKNPECFVVVDFTSAAAQDGFIGYFDNGFSGTSIEDGVATLDHVGFIIADGQISISVADGSTQSTTNVAGTVTATNSYRVTFDGTTAEYFINGSSVGTRTSNVPNGQLEDFLVVVIADATNAAKTVSVKMVGGIEIDVT